MVRYAVIALLAACGSTARPPLAPARSAAACREGPRRVETTGAIAGPVQHVTITGAGAQLPEVVAAVHTEAGTLFDQDVLRADVRRLWALDITSQIDVAVTDTGEGPDVAFALVAPPRIARVVGGEAYPELASLRALEGTLYDPARVRRIAALAEAALVANGYAHAHVHATADGACEATLRIDVDAGPRFRLAELTVTGGALPVERTTFERDLAQVNVVGGVFDENAFAEDLAQWAERHHARGWLDATAKTPQVTYDAAHARVSVHAAVTLGPRYRVGPFVIEGGDERARRLAEKMLAPLPGTVYDADAYQALADRVMDALLDAGYGVSTFGTRDPVKHILTVRFVLGQRAR
jgi:outer membrane protein assembly factor BamA